MDKDGVEPKCLPLATKYFESLKSSTSLLAQADKSRREKRNIEDVVISLIDSLGSTSIKQVRSRNETSCDMIQDKNVRANIDESILEDVTTVISSSNKENLITCLVTSSSSLRTKKLKNANIPSLASKFKSVLDNFGEAVDLFAQSDMSTTPPRNKVKVTLNKNKKQLT